MKDNEIKLGMKRVGQFSVNWTGNNTTQCGSLGQSVINYEVVIETTADELDSHGFIVDNNDIHAYFVEHYKHIKDFESCERIAIKACKYFHEKLSGMFKINVSISGNPSAAWLTAIWDKQERRTLHVTAAA